MKGNLRNWIHIAVGGAVFAASFAFYVYTAPADLAWFEGANYQRRVVLTEIGEGPWQRPLFVLLSQPFLIAAFGSIARTATLASAFFAAGACLFLYLLLKHLLLVAPQFIARRVGILAALTLAVSHTFWLRAVTPGPETLDAVLLSAVLYFLFRFVSDGRVPYLYVSMAILGLSLANNLMVLFLVPVFALFVRFVRPPLIRDFLIGRVRARGLLVFLVGCSFALAVAAWGWAKAGFQLTPAQQSWLTFWRHHLVLSWDGGLQGSLVRFVALLLYNFPPWTAVVGLVGLVELFRRQKYVFALLFPLLLLYSALAIILELPDPVPAHLPSWVLFSIAVGYGWWKLLAEAGWKGYVVALVVSASPLLVYRFAPTVLMRVGEDIRVRSVLGIPALMPVDVLQYWLNPDRRDTADARDFARSVLADLPDGARVTPASSNGDALLAPVRYVIAVEGAKPGVEVDDRVPLDSTRLEPSPGESVYIVGLYPPHPAFASLLESYHFLPSGHLFQVVPRSAVPGKVLVDSTEPTPLAGEWYGTVWPQGYAVRFSIDEIADGSFAGTAVLNEGAAEPRQATFTRISLIADAVVSRLSYQDRVHVQIDSNLVGNRMEGTWVVYEAPYLKGRFRVWKQPELAFAGQGMAQ